MVAEAEGLGADAVINVRYATSNILQGAAEVMVYGTAGEVDLIPCVWGWEAGGWKLIIPDNVVDFAVHSSPRYLTVRLSVAHTALDTMNTGEYY